MESSWKTKALHRIIRNIRPIFCCIPYISYLKKIQAKVLIPTQTKGREWNKSKFRVHCDTSSRWVRIKGRKTKASDHQRSWTSTTVHQLWNKRGTIWRNNVPMIRSIEYVDNASTDWSRWTSASAEKYEGNQVNAHLVHKQKRNHFLQKQVENFLHSTISDYTYS